VAAAEAKVRLVVLVLARGQLGNLERAGLELRG
jgi:hypothetical protein